VPQGVGVQVPLGAPYEVIVKRLETVKYDEKAFILQYEDDGGHTLTRINKSNETGTYTVRHYADGFKIKSWRK
jgi:hypothetical protein